MSLRDNKGSVQVIEAGKIICLAIILSGFANMAAADENTVSVRFDKAMLESPAGIESVYKKLTIAARRACVEPISVLNDRHERKVCKREMLAEFIGKISNRRLNQYAKSREHIADEILVASN